MKRMEIWYCVVYIRRAKFLTRIRSVIKMTERTESTNLFLNLYMQMYLTYMNAYLQLCTNYF